MVGYNGDEIDIAFPEGITEINKNAFNDCDSLASITRPSSVTSIGNSAFYNCTSLTSVTFGDNSRLTGVGEFAFEDCTSLSSITIPSSVASIGNYAFLDCTSLTKVTFENPDGWWRSYSSTATSGTAISSPNLSNAATAANYLTFTYIHYNWKRS